MPDGPMVTPGTERNLVGYGPNPPRVRWPNDARVALSFIINYEEGSEYSYLDGDGRNEHHGVTYDFPRDVRNLRVESQYEYGSRAGIWRLLRLFDQFGLQVTFHVSALAVERNPAVGRAIAEGGHEPCAHGWRWDEAWTLARPEEQERIRRAVESIAQTCGERPYGWYSRYGPSLNTRELLVEEGGFLYDSNAYNDDLPYFVMVGHKQHLVLPYTGTYNDGRFVGIPRFGSATDFLDDCRRALGYLWEEGATRPRMMAIALHPRLMGEPGRASALRELVSYATGLPGVWITRRVDIARWWTAHHETFTAD